MLRLLVLAALCLAPFHNVAWAFEETETVIYVKNGTNKTLRFSLYVECAGQGTGKFELAKVVAAGEVGTWRLPAQHLVATKVHAGQTLYGVGLVGADLLTGERMAWGLVGGAGMTAKERLVERVRHILVHPIGRL